MKDVYCLVNAYYKAMAQNKKTALATVVHVEGSSYRRPGARMLVIDDGQLTGAISGGCLEGDALRKALLAILQGQNKLVTYDTTDESDVKFGVQLGCNGIVHILFEPIKTEEEINPIRLLEKLMSMRTDAVLITLFSLTHGLQLGTCLLYRKDEQLSSLPHLLKNEVEQDARKALQGEISLTREYAHTAQRLKAFIEFVPPPVAVVIAGAGNDVQPLVDITFLLGWHTTIVDGRGSHASERRFPRANRVLVAKAAEVVSQVEIDKRTVFLLMTHNYNYDIILLKSLFKTACPYIGILGPKKKTERMFDELETDGFLIRDLERCITIYSPVGLDIGAETAAEIAVSIVAEIQAVLTGREGMKLRNKTAAIHHTSLSIDTFHE